LFLGERAGAAGGECGASAMRRASSQIWDVVEPVVGSMGYEMVGAVIGGKPGDRILRVYIDTPAGVTVDDCEAVSHQLSAVLDVEDPIGEPYVLEISSPGVDRPLFREADYVQYVGEQAFVRTLEPIEGRRRFKGLLCGIESGAVVIEVDGQAWRLPIEVVEEAHLIGEV